MELLIEERKYTVEEFLYQDDLDENHYYELIEGEIVKKSSPHYEHQRVSGKIFLKLQPFVTEKKLGEIFYAPIDVYLDDSNYYQPDLVFVSEAQKGILSEEGLIQGIPDLVIEILSPSTGKYDRGGKMRVYEYHSVKEYWIVDLANKLIEVYSHENQRFDLYSYALSNEKIKSKLFADLDLLVGAIF
jgi:Uma2 family endonuclease